MLHKPQLIITQPIEYTGKFKWRDYKIDRGYRKKPVVILAKPYIKNI